jgi:hypothetical protein
LYTVQTDNPLFEGIDENAFVVDPTAVEDYEDEVDSSFRSVVAPSPPPIMGTQLTPTYSRSPGFGGSTCIENMTASTVSAGYHHGIHAPGTWLNSVGWPTWEGATTERKEESTSSS